MPCPEACHTRQMFFSPWIPPDGCEIRTFARSGLFPAKVRAFLLLSIGTHVRLALVFGGHGGTEPRTPNAVAETTQAGPQRSALRRAGRQPCRCGAARRPVCPARRSGPQWQDSAGYRPGRRPPFPPISPLLFAPPVRMRRSAVTMVPRTPPVPAPGSSAQRHRRSAP